MDILNWLYLKKQQLIRTTLDSPKDLLLLGADVSFQKRGDKYQSYAIPAEDFLALVARPYKVYTALLTQSGGDDPQTITSGDLTIGVTYMMDGITLTTDFTNVGAPYNANGVYFVATGITPNNWGVADLNYNTGAPVVTVLENTIGNVWFEYNGIGNYIAYVPIIAEQKQVVFSPTNAFKANSNELYIRIANNSIDGQVEILTTDGTSGIDGEIRDLPIEIRVYN